LRLENYGQTVQDCNKAIELSSDYGKAYFRRAQAHLFLGSWKETLEDFTNALIYLDSDRMQVDAEIYVEVLKEIIKNKKDLDVKENFDTTLTEVEKQVGNIFFKKNNYEAAIEHYTKATKLSKNAVLYCNRAAAFLHLSDISTTKASDLKLALNDANLAIHLDPQYSKAYWRKGQIYHQMKRYKKAISCFEKANLLQPNPQFKRELQQSMKALKETQSSKVEKLLHYEQVLVPRKRDIWNLTKNPETRKLLQEPKNRELLKIIADSPKIIPQIMKEKDNREIVLQFMNAIDPDFKSQLEMDELEFDDDEAEV